MWMTCQWCEGEYQDGKEHTPRDCVRSTIYQHAYKLHEAFAEDWDGVADDVMAVLAKRGIGPT